MSGLPSLAVYAVLGLLAALENAIPPLPTDAAVALGAFLSHSGRTTPLGVFLVIWACNVAGAAGVYFLSRRFGRQLFATGVGRRLLAPRALALIEREYLRFGVVGIFLARCLPGFRAVVAPFAGLTSLSPARALIPIGLASAAWYGALTIIGVELGDRWETIDALLHRANRTLGAVAAVIVALVLVLYGIHRRRRARQPLWSAVGAAFDTDRAARIIGPDEARRSAALLLLEVAYADPALSEAERDTVTARLRARWRLAAATPNRAATSHRERARLDRYRERIVDRFGADRRTALLQRVWEVALDADPEGADASLARRAAEFLGLSADEVARARARVEVGA